jgi:hypothetical protein
MRKFTIKFFYFTDLRADWTGEASHDTSALTKAMEEKGLYFYGWANSDGFRVEIHSENERDAI